MHAGGPVGQCEGQRLVREQRYAERSAVSGVVDGQVECPLGQAHGFGAVVHPAEGDALHGEPEAVGGVADDVVVGDEHVIEVDHRLVAAGVAEHGRHACDLESR